MEVSAKTAINVDKLFTSLTSDILNKITTYHKKKLSNYLQNYGLNNGICIEGLEDENQKKKTKCCW